MSESADMLQAYFELKRQGKNPNFLFVGGGISHAAYFSSFALFARDENISLSGIVYDCAPAYKPVRFTEEHIVGVSCDDYRLLRRNPKNGARNTGVLSSLMDMIKGCFVKCPVSGPMEIPLTIENIKNFEDPFFFIYPATGLIPAYALEFLSSLNRSVIHIVLEEGIGSYLATLKDWWFLGIDRERNGTMRLVKSAVLHALWPFVKRKQAQAERAMPRVPFTLFHVSNGVLYKNQIPCAYGAKAFELLAANHGLPSIDYSNTVIIATTRFAELGGIEYEIASLEAAIHIFRQYGFRVIVRPHPGERETHHYAYLANEIDEYMDLPLESLIAYSKRPPVALLGFMSSSQLIANALWGIKGICLTYVLDEIWAALVKGNAAIALFDRDVQHAQKLFEGYVDFPHGIEQLRESALLLRGA